MAIRASSSREIDALITDLSADGPNMREAAIARLTIIGPRSVERLVSVVESRSPAAARIAALRALEGIASPRALQPALISIDDPHDDVACAAIATARVFLHGRKGADVVDLLTRTALDTRRHQDVRIAAVEALSGLESGTLKPLWRALADDSNPAVRSYAQQAGTRRSVSGYDPSDVLTSAGAGDLPADPAGLRRAIEDANESVPLPLLLRLVEQIREREAALPPPRRDEWTKTRAAGHVALAKRGSRLALYDLRESLESTTTPLPVEFLSALSMVGNASCLEAIAAAYAKSPQKAVGSDWWRQQLAVVFHDIVKRERLTKKHAVLKKIAKRWGEVVANLA
jgi:HEAT repeat protein